MRRIRISGGCCSDEEGEGGATKHDSQHGEAARAHAD